MIQTAARVSIPLAVALGLAGAACRSAPAPPAAPPEPSPRAWAVVNGREITADDVEKAYRRSVPPEAAPTGDEAFAARLGLLDELILQELLLERARALQLAVTDAELAEAQKERWGGIPEAELKAELGRRTLTEDDLREALRRELLAQKVLAQQVEARVAVGDEEIHAFFETNRAQFNLAEEAYHLAQIVVTPARETQRVNRTGDDAGTPQEAQAKTERLIERLKAGADFGELAADYSEHAETAQRGGDLGLVPVSVLRQSAPALARAVIGAEPGTVRVVSDGGAHAIVLVVAREPAGQRDLDTPGVKERIAGVLRDRRVQLLRAAYLTTLREEATVVNLMARRVVESAGRVPPPSPGAQPRE